MFCLDRGGGRIDIVWHDIAAVTEAELRVLAVAKITFDHHRSWFEDRCSDLNYGELLAVCLPGIDDWCIRRKHEVDANVRRKIGLELCDVDITFVIPAQRSGE